MKTIIDVVNDAILDVSINPIVESGIFDPNNDEHIFLLIENLDGRLDEEAISEAVQALRLEGKHPDRQAYNKEGWLVTFPSKQYRDAALKKGTHSLADPTHGKGGMNLYYKRRGKQKRMTQQQPTVAGTPDAQQSTQQSAQPPAQPTTQTATSQPANQQTLPPDQGSQLPASDEAPKSAVQEPKVEPEQKPSEPAPAIGASGGAVSSVPSQKKLSEPTGDAPEKRPEAPSEPNKVEVTEKFAASKGWESTPYGEWRSAEGETVAVVSLSGEVTPIKSNDREELKLFASKQN
jgi:hypothetical protein